MFPQEKKYVLSLAQQSLTYIWDGQLTFAASDELVLVLPSRFKFDAGNATVSLGYTGFWQEYALLPLFSSEQALLCQAKNQAFALVSGKNAKRAIGYEHTMTIGALSVLAWMQPKEVLSSFQIEWGAPHSRWGVVGKVFLESSCFALHTELLFTPVKGMEVFVSSSCEYESSKLSFTYGEDPYPSRYSFSLALQGKFLQVTFMMEDWFGSKPLYGGFSTMRKRRQSSEARVTMSTGYLSIFFSDTYEFTPRGSDFGSILMKSTWGGCFGQLSAQYRVSRGPSVEMKGYYKLSVVLDKVTLCYTETGYDITLSDSVALGKGICTWKLKKHMGKAVSLALLYSVTSDR